MPMRGKNQDIPNRIFRPVGRRYLGAYSPTRDYWHRADRVRTSGHCGCSLSTDQCEAIELLVEGEIWKRFCAKKSPVPKAAYSCIARESGCQTRHVLELSHQMESVMIARKDNNVRGARNLEREVMALRQNGCLSMTDFDRRKALFWKRS